MAFTKQKFGLFFSLPLDEQDWMNLSLSRVRLVLLMLEFADATTLTRLRSMGCRVILRANEDHIYNDAAPTLIRNQVQVARQYCPVESVIIGNEADHAQNLDYGSAGWGQAWAYTHRRRFDNVRRELQAIGVKVVSPALIMRSISEDEQPAPGRVAWREILTLPDNGAGYLDADYNGVHLYSYGWDGPVDELRWKFALKHYAELWHKPLVIDEVGISGGHTPLEKMRGYIDMAEILLQQREGRQHPLGQRVEALIPFVSNGVPGGAWDARYLLRDPACYRLLGDWIGA